MALLLLILLSASLLFPAVSGGGFAVNYGQLANNLPDPKTAAALIKSIHVASVRIYDTKSSVIKAFANSGVQLTVSLPNENMNQISDPGKAQSWLQSNVLCYLPATKITGIAVGNEVLTSNYSSSDLLTAMDSIQSALVSLKLDRQISVTTAHNFGILKTSYPPSAGEFRPDLAQPLAAILDFHCRTGSAFSINAYPFFAYKSDPKRISLKYALLESGDPTVDSGSGLKYDNMFVAQIDAARSAMEKLRYGNVCLEVSETGWPSLGDADEPGASPENARTYNWNLLKLVEANKGTPKAPHMDLNVYVFGLFNENQKPGPTSERNFGLFKPDGTPVYDLGFNLNGGGGGQRSPSGSSPVVVMSPPNGNGGYIPDDGNSGRFLSGGAVLLSLFCLIISAAPALLQRL